MIHAKIGMWENHSSEGERGGRCLALFADEGDVCELPARMVASVSADQSLVQLASDEARGAKFCYFGRKTSLPFGACFYENRGQVSIAVDGLPAFELMDVEVSADGAIHLPPTHRLPWPSRRSLLASADPSGMAFRAVEARITSAVAYGVTNLMDNPIPGHVRSLLAPGAFAEARRTALALAGVS